jgi:hypothetical protein
MGAEPVRIHACWSRCFVGLLLLASACRCGTELNYSRLSKYCEHRSGGACPTEADVIAEALRMAEATWLRRGECLGPSVGTSSYGMWVDPNQFGSSNETEFFSPSGTLIGARSCSELCNEFGLSPLLTRKGPTRDLCREARSALVARGARVSRFWAQAMLSSDGGSISRAGEDWLVPFGTWTAILPNDAGPFTFSISDDNEAKLVLQGAPEPWVGRANWDGSTVKLKPWLELPDGGSSPGAVHAMGNAD